MSRLAALRGRRPPATAGIALLMWVPGALVVALSFFAGGYFPGPTALAAVGLIALLVVHLTVAARPFAGLSATYVLVVALLAILAVWTLLSSTWSDAPGRAVVEYDRVLLYLLAAVTLGAAGRTVARVRWLVRGLALAALAVCLCALVTRTLPDLWRVEPTLANDRLSFPLTYWNALGLLAALGLSFCFGLSADVRERAAVRVAAAAALPVLATTLLFTFSRGAIAAGAVGLLTVAILGRSPGLLGALVAAIPAVVAVRAGYAADLLATDRPTTAAATAQGHDVAVVVGACVVAAALLRALALLVDRRVARMSAPPALRRPVVAVALAVVAGAGVAGAAVVLGAPGTIDRQYDRFVGGDPVNVEGDQRGRLLNPGNNGRLDQWRVAVRQSRDARAKGTGAGTYALLWDRGRPLAYQVEDAHSLYVEMLAELGVVGLALVVGVIVLLLGAFVVRARGPDRGVYAALAGAGLVWALHAGIDWDWEVPAVTLWLFAAGGLVTASAVQEGPVGRSWPATARVLAALGVLALALVPARVFLSEGPLRDGARALASGDCVRAVDRSLDSIAAIGSRAEAYALLAYCDVRLGQTGLAVRAMGNAVRRDPRNWEFRYGLALVRGAAGRDPRSAARAALRLNPREQLARDAVRRFATDDPAAWRRRALRSRLPRD